MEYLSLKISTKEVFLLNGVLGMAVCFWLVSVFQKALDWFEMKEVLFLLCPGIIQLGRFGGKGYEKGGFWVVLIGLALAEVLTKIS